MVEVEPITCWWRTSTSAVRTGESFGLTLTCAVVETDANKVVPDFSKLDPTVVQLPPFEVLGGTHAGDLVTPGKRFFQYDYRLRLIAEDAFGNDVSIPPLEISYRIESKVAGGDTTQGREQSYSLPRASVRLISLVPDDTSDIREAPAAMFTADREPRLARQPDADGRGRAVRARRRRGDRDADRHAAPQGADSRRPRRRTWRRAPSSARSRRSSTRCSAPAAAAGRRSSPAARSRRCASPAAYATNRAVGQRPAATGETPVDGVLVVRSFGRGDVYVSGAATPESTAFASAPAGLADALQDVDGRRDTAASKSSIRWPMKRSRPRCA